MAPSLRWISGILLVLCAMLASRSEAAVQAVVVGGAGGTAFVDPLPIDGARIAAVLVHVGARVHSVRTVYESRDKHRALSPRHGGTGGLARLFELDPDEHIVAVSGRHGEHVHSIRFHTNKRASPEYGRAAGTPYRIDIQPGQTVTGFAGRAGQFLDAVGLAIAVPHRAPAYAGVREAARAGTQPDLRLPPTGQAARHHGDALSPVAP